MSYDCGLLVHSVLVGGPEEMKAPSRRFDDIAVILVRPAGKRNIGSAARAMKNTGFGDLVLVAPPDFHCRETYDMAPHSHDILDRARVTATLEEAIVDRHLVFGITARTRFKAKRLIPEEAYTVYTAALNDALRTAIVFGPEDHGLSNEHLSLCQHLVGIQTHPDCLSLNLAQAVLLICHAFFSRRAPTLAEVVDKREFSSADGKLRIEEAAAALLTESGFLTAERDKPIRDTLRRLVHAGAIETRDTRNLLAAIRHVRYVLKGTAETE